MRSPALGEAVTHLPWLSPCAASLAALCRSPAVPAWEQVRADPACVLLIVRQAAAVLSSPALSFFPALLHDPAVLEGAVRLLDQPGAGFVDWNLPATQPVYHASLRYARWARCLAERTGRCDPENAWVSGLIAGLGWLSICAVDPSRATACLQDPAFGENPSAVQRRLWGFDQAGIARRLARRWRLPAWLAAIVGHLGLPAEIAQAQGAEPDLFQVVQLAVGLAQREQIGLGLALGAEPEVTGAALGLPAAEVDTVRREVGALLGPTFPGTWAAPASEPLLRDLLALAAENCRLADGPVLDRLETEMDHLHRALEDQRTGETERLQTGKLRALAEFAAGAGHEINNPLAVISGQAQYLLGHETEPARQRALQTIIRQSQRIHDVLADLMQFARPPRPQKQPVDLGGLIREVAASLSDLAAQQRVQLVCPEPKQPVVLDADPRQLRTILTCLLRNAIEAAPLEGWAGVRLEETKPDRVELLVEDSGRGPTAAQREHMFDPFYSGRQAGRSRGLGLSTAWRLAREHGGDVCYDPIPGGPTRFVLSLPRVTAAAPPIPEGMAG